FRGGGRQIRRADDPMRTRGVTVEIEGGAVERDPSSDADALREAIRQGKAEEAIREMDSSELPKRIEVVPARRAARPVVPKLEIFVSLGAGVAFEAQVFRVRERRDEPPAERHDHAREVERRGARVLI